MSWWTSSKQASKHTFIASRQRPCSGDNKTREMQRRRCKLLHNWSVRRHRNVHIADSRGNRTPDVAGMQYWPTGDQRQTVPVPLWQRYPRWRSSVAELFLIRLLVLLDAFLSRHPAVRCSSVASGLSLLVSMSYSRWTRWSLTLWRPLL